MMENISRLLQIMSRLRDPVHGCPWDRQQTFASIVPHTIEEAYEVADAIQREHFTELRDELGDLLFQVVFHAQMAAEAGRYDFDDIAGAIADKLTRRHPHVFGDDCVADAQAQSAAWERHKRAERRQRDGNAGVLDGVARALPALVRAQKLQQRAAEVGFDWPSIEPVWGKIDEELAELRAEMKAGARVERRRAELGDLLFACVNLARHMGVDPEQALREANGRFESRFRHVEGRIRATGRDPGDATLDEMDRYWDEAKRAETRDD